MSDTVMPFAAYVIGIAERAARPLRTCPVCGNDHRGERPRCNRCKYEARKARGDIWRSGPQAGGKLRPRQRAAQG